MITESLIKGSSSTQVRINNMLLGEVMPHGGHWYTNSTSGYYNSKSDAVMALAVEMDRNIRISTGGRSGIDLSALAA